MFFIIWGARNIIKDFGPVGEFLCNNCNNKKHWKLLRSSRWFTIFYIPIFPYKTKYFILCPTCEYGIQLEENKFKEMKVIADNNNVIINGTVNLVKNFNSINQKSTSSLPTSSSIDQSINIKDGECKNCNNKNNKESKFCKNCGLRL